MSMVNEPDLNSPYVVLKHNHVGELMNDVNQHIRTGNWKLLGGIACAEQSLESGKKQLLYLQAIVVRTSLAL
jgi:hypothetical protein